MHKIYFHHFHKCAGTSMVRYLESNYSLFGPHANGNILDDHNIAFPIHLYDSSRLDEFLERVGSDSFCYEWGIPDMQRIRAKGFYTVTVIREPTERLLSNYKFDIQSGNVCMPFLEYVSNIAVPFWSGNYYTSEISSSMLRSGIERINSTSMVDFILNQFDEIWLMEKGEFILIKGAGHLADGFKVQHNKSKKRFSLFRSIKTPSNVSDYCRDDLEFYELVKASLKRIGD